eukprot:403335488
METSITSSSSQIDPTKKCKAKIKQLFSTKYTEKELQEILDSVSQFNIFDKVENILKPEANEQCKSFLGEDNKFTFTNAQQVINQMQNLQGKILVIDTRSLYQYHLSHLENSINFPVDLCNDEFFTKFNPKQICDTIIKNKFKKELFDQRRRMYVFIIASQNEITHYLEKLPKVFDPEALAPYIEKYKNNKEVVENLVSIRNAILLYKALKNERIRELYLCVNGFNIFKQKYPHFCKFRTTFLYPKNEILERRLYLGDHIHAQDKTILQNLKITHILNVSNTIPNYFEDDPEMQIEYLKINIEDTSSVPIKLSFPVAYQFLDNAFNECKTMKRDKTKRKNLMVEQCFVSSNQIRERAAGLLNSTALLTPIQVDFKSNKTTRVSRKDELTAHRIDRHVDTFNRISYNDNVVLVHCAMGVSRSASCVIMFIMKLFKLGFEDTLDFVKAKRHVVEPNEGFAFQLIEFEDNKMKFANEEEKGVKANNNSRNMMFAKRGRTAIFD